MPAAVLDNQRSLLVQLDTQPRVREAMESARSHCRMFRVLGVYDAPHPSARG